MVRKKLKSLCLLALFACASAQAYDIKQLDSDCRAQELHIGDERPAVDVPTQAKTASCLAYIRGVVDGYTIGETLAGKIGVRLNAFCLPNDSELDFRLTRAVVIQLERLPPRSTVSPATLVAGALAKAFPCPE